MRYRKGLINRKIKTAVIELLYVGSESIEIERGAFELVAHTSKTDKLVKAVAKQNHIKYVIKLLSVKYYETLYTMTDEDFIKHATKHKEELK